MGRSGREPPQSGEPGAWTRDDQRIMRRADLMRALREQPARVAVGQPQLAEALERDQRQDDDDAEVTPLRAAARRR